VIEKRRTAVCLRLGRTQYGSIHLYFM
jgi:hypothetical protein